MTVLNTFLRYLRKSIQSRFTSQPYQKEAFFETPYFPSKYLEHLLGLTKSKPIRALFHGKDNKEDILEGGNFLIIAHQFKGPHEGIRIGVDLRRQQLSPAEHLPLKIREGKLKTHVFENHFIHGKDMVLVLRAHLVRCARKYYLQALDFTNGAEGSLSCSVNRKR